MTTRSNERSAAVVRGHLLTSAAVKQRTAEVCVDAIAAAADLIAEAFRNGGKLLLCGNGGSAADCQHLAAEFTSRLSADFARPGLPALALTTDTSFLTGYANDFDFEGIFARQVQALGKPGDVLLGISTSGGSKNVVQAAETAKKLGMKVIVLTGVGGLQGADDARQAADPTSVPGPRHSTSSSPSLRSGGDSRFDSSTISIPSTLQRDPPCTRLPWGGPDASAGIPLVCLADIAICIPSDDTRHIQEAHLAVEHILCHVVERALFAESCS